MDGCREGDLVETREGLVFGVKGLMHPPGRVVAFLRYVLDPAGERTRGPRRYRKIYPLTERYEYLERNYPKYLFYDPKMHRMIQSVALGDIERVYKPEEGLEQLMYRSGLRGPERIAVELSREIAEESGVDTRRMGITGSILVGLHREDSDVDLVVYGVEEGNRVFSALKVLRSAGGPVSPYDDEAAMRIARFRWGQTKLPLKELAAIEREKVLHGTVRGRDYFIRLVEDWGDIEHGYEDFEFVQLGGAAVEGTISDDSYSIFTPSRYRVERCRSLAGEPLEVSEICSFRGRFTEQAHDGDAIRARGEVEEVVFRGRERRRRLRLERPSDYLIPLKRSIL